MAMSRENYKQVSQALEQARALDFEVRNTPGACSAELNPFALCRC
jgi:hypothetical protein